MYYNEPDFHLESDYEDRNLLLPDSDEEDFLIEIFESDEEYESDDNEDSDD